MKKYNVLLLMTDQHRFDCLGCYGNQKIETPNIDQLASEGVIFKNAYTPSPSCIPARACLISGMNQWNTGILGMGKGQGPMGGGFPHTLPGELAKGGYHTQGVGKMHFGPQRILNGFHNTVIDESGRRGKDPNFVSDYKTWFDRNKPADMNISDHGLAWNSWVARPYHAPEYLHPTNWTVNESINFLKKKDPSMPFFLKTSFARPHSPYDALPYYFDLYMNKDLDKPYVGEWAKMHDVPEDGANVNAWRGVRTPEEIKRARSGYYGSVNHIDHQIGRLLNHLTVSGQYENTIIIFTSDHGDMLGDHNLWRKTYAYEGSAHIPFIIRLPKELRKNIKKEVFEPVTLYDIMPTILDLCSLEIPDTVDGMSLKGLMQGKNDGFREYLHGEHCECYSYEQDMHFLTDGRYKYIWFPQLGKEQFFDLQKDPGELMDMSGSVEYKDEIELWRMRLVKELEPRKTNLTSNGELVCTRGMQAVTSPNYAKRIKEWGFDMENGEALKATY